MFGVVKGEAEAVAERGQGPFGGVRLGRLERDFMGLAGVVATGLPRAAAVAGNRGVVGPHADAHLGCISATGRAS